MIGRAQREQDWHCPITGKLRVFTSSWSLISTNSLSGECHERGSGTWQVLRQGRERDKSAALKIDQAVFTNSNHRAALRSLTLTAKRSCYIPLNRLHMSYIKLICSMEENKYFNSPTTWTKRFTPAQFSWSGGSASQEKVITYVTLGWVTAECHGAYGTIPWLYLIKPFRCNFDITFV